MAKEEPYKKIDAKCCKICDQEETSPEAKKAILMVAYSFLNKAWVCGKCYSGLKRIQDIDKAKDSFILDFDDD